MNKSLLRAHYVMGLLLAAVLFLAPKTTTSQTWVPKNINVNANSGGFHEYLPVGYNDPANSSKKYPVILFIHGVGYLGTDLSLITYGGLPLVISQGNFPKTFTVGGQTYSFIVIAPQFKSWPSNADVEAYMNYIQANYRADANRMYLTGLSMGGGVTWEYASSSPTTANRLAAIVPVCGASSSSSYKCQTMANANLPVFATHNADDDVVTVLNTIYYVDGINTYNPTPNAIKMIWPTGGHNAWSATYEPTYKLAMGGTMNIYEWMLQYSRGAAPAPSPLQASISSSTNVNCNGGSNGSATVSVTGGSAPYSYSWNTSPAQTGSTASNLKAGSYTVTVKDAAGSTVTASVSITEPSALVFNVAPGTIATYGGTTNVVLSASGGTPGYTYSGPSNNVSAGTYTYTVTDAKGCTSSKTITITQPAAPPSMVLLSTSATNASCNGSATGSATVSASGGTAPYSYSWNTIPAQTTATATGLNAGTYTVTVTDAANTQATATVTVGQPSKLSITVDLAAPITVYGGQTYVNLSATGGTAPYTYSGRTTNLNAGTYTYTVTDAAGCTDTRSITITQPAPPAPAPSLAFAGVSKTDVSCFGAANGKASVNVTGGVAPYTYSWNTNPVQTGASVSGLSAGTFTVTVKDAAGAAISSTVSIAQPAALQLQVNPGTIAVAGGTTNVGLSATGGTAPYTYTGSTSNVSAGTYSYTVTDANGCTDSKTITISQPAPTPAPAPAPALALVAVTKTDITCNGAANGKASVSVTGGVTPYSYSWTSSPAQSGAAASGLSAGTYTVTVRDAAGATVSSSVTIAEPSALQLKATAGTITVAGGTTNVSLSASGGTAPYTYTGTTSNVTAGTYTYYVTDANTCKASTSITITEPSKLKVTAKPGTIKCKGGSCNVSLSVEGGVAPYTYTGDTLNVKAGTYTYTVKDASGAISATTLTVTEPDALVLDASASTITKIGGTTNVNLKANGGTAPYAYTGNPNNLKAGNYSYQVSDANGCTASSSVEVKEPGVTLSAFNLSTTDTAVSLGWSTSYEFAIDRFEVEKAKDDKTFTSLNRARSKGNGKGNQDYRMPDLSQVSGSNTYRLYAITTFGEKIYLGEKKIYFNEKGTVQIRNLVNKVDITVTSSREEKVTIMIFDVLGRPVKQVVMSKTSSVLRTTVPMDNLRNGLYVVKVFTSGGMQSVKQVLKQ